MSHQEPRITVDPINRDSLIIPGPHIAVDPSDPSGNTLFAAEKSQVGESPERSGLGDTNGDGRVDGTDLARAFESQTKPHADGLLATTYGRGAIDPDGGNQLSAHDGTSNTLMMTEPVSDDDGPSTLLPDHGPGSQLAFTLDGKGTDVNVEEIELLNEDYPDFDAVPDV